MLHGVQDIIREERKLLNCFSTYYSSEYSSGSDLYKLRSVQYPWIRYGISWNRISDGVNESIKKMIVKIQYIN